MRKVAMVIALLASAVCAPAWGQECSQTIEGNDLIQYNLSEIRVSADCGEVTITLRHVGLLRIDMMGHNFVVVATENYLPLANDAQEAGPPNYLPEGDARVIAATDTIGGGEETSVTFDISGLEAGGDYTFFCTFPAHHVLMNGKFIIE